MPGGIKEVMLGLFQSWIQICFFGTGSEVQTRLIKDRIQDPDPDPLHCRLNIFFFNLSISFICSYRVTNYTIHVTVKYLAVQIKMHNNNNRAHFLVT